MQSMGMRILVVEKDAATAMDLEGLLTDAAYCVTGVAASVEEAYELARQGRPDLALLDLDIVGGLDGIDLARRLYEDFSVRHVYLSGYTEPEVIARANRTDPLGYLVKPYTEAQLLACIKVARCRNERNCAASDAPGSSTPFVLDVKFLSSRPAVFAKERCPMEHRCGQPQPL